MLAYGQHLVLQELVLCVHTCREAIEVRGLDDTQVLIVAQREETASLVGAVADRNVVLLYDTCASGLVKPVGIGSWSGACVIQVFLHGDTIEYRSTLGVVSPVITIAKTVGVRVHTVIDVCLPHHLSIFLCIQDLHLVCIGGNCDRTIEVNLNLSLLTFLGSDDDNTIGGTATIDRCRGSILQYLDALDVVTI